MRGGVAGGVPRTEMILAAALGARGDHKKKMASIQRQSLIANGPPIEHRLWNIQVFWDSSRKNWHAECRTQINSKTSKVLSVDAIDRDTVVRNAKAKIQKEIGSQ
jgi:hypothetical protein